MLYEVTGNKNYFAQMYKETPSSSFEDCHQKETKGHNGFYLQCATRSAKGVGQNKTSIKQDKT